MSDQLLIVEDIGRIDKNNLADRLWQMSAGGQVELSKEEWKKIPLEERGRALKLIEIFIKHPELREESQIRQKGGKFEEEKPIILNDESIEKGFRRLSKDKREDVLRMSVEAENIKLKQKAEAKKNRKSNITPIANLSKKSWQKLPKNGREAVLRKISNLQNELRNK